jgi:hypothetical protein
VHTTTTVTTTVITMVCSGCTSAEWCVTWWTSSATFSDAIGHRKGFETAQLLDHDSRTSTTLFGEVVRGRCSGTGLSDPFVVQELASMPRLSGADPA